MDFPSRERAYFNGLGRTLWSFGCTYVSSKNTRGTPAKGESGSPEVAANPFQYGIGKSMSSSTYLR